jgi:transcriptional regulator with XRE-family HTH domain
MTIFFAQNIKILRKKKKLTQEELAVKLGIKRSLIGSYEEGRAVPKHELLAAISRVLDVNIDELLTSDLSQNLEEKSKAQSNPGLKILTTVVTPDNRERVCMVPVKASAGYLNGLSDTEFIGALPHFSMPVTELSAERTYRVFQIRGDSMLPIPPLSYLFCDYVETLDDVRDGKTYVLIVKGEGVVYKRVYNQVDRDGLLLLKSDNPEYEPYTIPAEDVLEIWRVLGYLTFDLPGSDAGSIQKLTQVIIQNRNKG